MSEKQPEDVENDFFESLISSDVDRLQRIVSSDVVLIDVMSGSEVSGQQLEELIQSGHLKFHSIERLGFNVRIYGNVAIITGQTVMAGEFDGQQFKINSAYTHVFVKENESWRMVSAQGTPVTSSTAT